MIVYNVGDKVFNEISDIPSDLKGGVEAEKMVSI